MISIRIMGSHPFWFKLLRRGKTRPVNVMINILKNGDVYRMSAVLWTD